MSRKSGFTLIELLVVIAIIAILAAILFPVFAAAKKAGQKAVCQGNVKQLLQGAQMYEDDYQGGILPGCVDLDGNGGSWVNGQQQMNEMWPALIDKYIRQLRLKQNGGNNTSEMRGVYLCPATPPIIPTNPSNRLSFDDAQSLARPYGYNYMYLGGDPNNGKTKNFHNTSEVVKATTTVRIIENWNFGSADYRYGCGSMMAYPPMYPSPSELDPTTKSPSWASSGAVSYCNAGGVWPPGWHSGTSTVGWFDGHVSSVKLCAPKSASGEAMYTSVETKTFNNDNDNTHGSPYFRLRSPKP